MADSAASAPVPSRVLVEPTGLLQLSSMQLKERLWSLAGASAGHSMLNHRRTGPGGNWVDPGAASVERRLMGGAAAGRLPLWQWDAGDSTCISVAGHHPSGVKALEVEFNCTGEGQRCMRGCGCPVVRYRTPTLSAGLCCEASLTDTTPPTLLGLGWGGCILIGAAGAMPRTAAAARWHAAASAATAAAAGTD